MLRTVLIGLGVQGKKYAEIIYKGEIENMELVAVVARSEKNCKWSEENIKGVKIYPSCEELFDNFMEFDAVIITTPHESHPRIAMMAFEKSKANKKSDKLKSKPSYDLEKVMSDAMNNTDIV